MWLHDSEDEEDLCSIPGQGFAGTLHFRAAPRPDSNSAEGLGIHGGSEWQRTGVPSEHVRIEC